MNQLYQRYAVALFSLASEKNQIEDYLKECEQLIEIFEKNALSVFATLSPLSSMVSLLII